ncbi:hypothetical protein RFI_35950, partial [Reticulomyxa filosa]
SCFSKEWILQLNQQDQITYFICLICKQVARNPIEMDCAQHQDSSESLIVGANCLKQFLSINPNSCPVQHHNGCLYAPSRAVQVQIDSQTTTRRQRPKEEENEKVTCDFKGKIKELNDHLDNSCPLKLFGCWYKPLGCVHTFPKQKLQQHLVSKLKFRFDLVVKFVDSLKQTIQFHQVLIIFFLKANIDKLQITKKKKEKI